MENWKSPFKASFDKKGNFTLQNKRAAVQTPSMGLFVLLWDFGVSMCQFGSELTFQNPLKICFSVALIKSITLLSFAPVCEGTLCGTMHPTTNLSVHFNHDSDRYNTLIWRGTRWNQTLVLNLQRKIHFHNLKYLFHLLNIYLLCVMSSN